MDKISFFEKHSILSSIFLAFISIIVVLLALEGLARITLVLTQGREYKRVYFVDDQELGWIHNVQMAEGMTKNKCGEDVFRAQPKHPLIVKFPKYNNGRKVLFIGDSFTHAHTVSPGKAFYDVFEELTKDKFSVYAAGAGGYGNIQEYLMLKKIYDDIKPDIVVWQVCDNDPINNRYELDRTIFSVNNQRIRPFLNLEDNTVVVRNPGFWIHKHSYLYRSVFRAMSILDFKYNLGLLKKIDSLMALESGRQKEEFENGIEVLNRVLAMAAGTFPKTKFIGFYAFGGEFEKRFADIFNQNGGTYFNDFYSHINTTEDTCLPLDPHWNYKGHKDVGKLMYDFFQKNNLL